MVPHRSLYFSKKGHHWNHQTSSNKGHQPGFAVMKHFQSWVSPHFFWGEMSLCLLCFIQRVQDQTMELDPPIRSWCFAPLLWAYARCL